ncbi:MAG: hypothetical protein HRT45_05790 [Bdellovibrionales bacterium]|nr:hypothetical protein [Bdellovibrionales bacterium]
MYRRYFGKDGDQGGLNYWVDEYEDRGEYKTVERDLIYNSQSTESAILTGNTQYRNSARSFLNKNGFSIPNWLN